MSCLLRTVLGFLLAAAGGCGPGVRTRPAPERLRVTPEGKGFQFVPSGAPFTPWGFNYDHDERGRLLEEYWSRDWPKVERDFAEMKRMGATVVRLHLQFGRFMKGPEEADPEALRNLRRLLDLAGALGLYLDLTGLGSYRKSDVPAWYDRAGEADRWAMQARFWEAVSETARASPAVFCYNLMNEPASAGGPSAEWLGGLLGGFTYGEVLSKDPGSRSRDAVAREWVDRMARAVRKHDPDRLLTVGLYFVFEAPGAISLGSDLGAIAAPLDFLSVHAYPKEKNLAEQVKLLGTLAVGKPLVLEETFPMNCSMDTFGRFLEETRRLACGWIGFYWGKPLTECRRSGELGDALLAGWLEFFIREGGRFKGGDR